MTYNVFGGTLNLALSISVPSVHCCLNGVMNDDHSGHVSLAYYTPPNQSTRAATTVHG